jgi:hypothetical protein
MPSIAFERFPSLASLKSQLTIVKAYEQRLLKEFAKTKQTYCPKII